MQKTEELEKSLFSTLARYANVVKTSHVISYSI